MIKEIKSKDEWGDFINETSPQTFLQTWEWGELQKEIGYEILRIGLYKKNNLLAVAQVIKLSAKRGRFLFIPHGPISKNLFNPLPAFKKFLVNLAKREKFNYIRISPLVVNSEKNLQLYRRSGFRNSPIHMHAENVWVLDINTNEDAILKAMRKTTRYLIRKAEKEEVVVKKSKIKKDISIFWNVYKKTVQRENFTPFSKSFITNEFLSFDRSDNALFFHGYEKNSNKCLASALIIFTKNGAFYHQGASLHSKTPVSYLLQWEIIKEAKNRGCKTYNFWGVAPNEKKDHPWYGLSLFKKGYGGYQIDYLPTQDLIISPTYYFAFIYEKFLRWKRKF